MNVRNQKKSMSPRHKNNKIMKETIAVINTGIINGVSITNHQHRYMFNMLLGNIFQIT